MNHTNHLRRGFCGLLALFCLLPVWGCSSSAKRPAESVNGSSAPAVTEPVTKAPVLAETSGHAESQESRYIILYADWTARTRDYKTAEVTFRIGLRFYSIDMKARPGMGVLSVNGIDLGFSSPELKETENVLHTRLFTEETVSVPMDPDGTFLLDLFVSWPCRATYHGTYLEDLTVRAEGQVIGFD